jgi:hypothetical protein
MNENEKKQSKLQIQSLAELCINKIYENKFLINQKKSYTNQINFIKKILINNSEIEKNDNTKKNIPLIEEIKQYYNSIISSNFQLKKEEKKLFDKLESYKDNLSNEDSKDKQLLANAQYDNLLLMCQVQEKEDIIKSLNKSLESSKQSAYFKENKREIQVNNKWGEYYVNLDLNNLSEKMMGECQNFIQYRNKCEKKEKEKNKLKKDIDFYQEIIKYIKNYIGYDNDQNKKESKKKNEKKKNSKNKKLLTKTIILKNDNELSLFDKENNLFDDNIMIDEEKKKKEEENYKEKEKEKKQLCSSVFIDENNYESLFKYQSHDINNSINKNHKTKKKSKDIMHFLTVDELFDVNNHEGKAEAIIDDELHSDDETVFEIKVKPLKKITIHYIPKIKKQVPRINLSQIEFNKQKVMNEADLYSLQRRKFKMQNLEENIKTMKKKIKKMRHICKLNKKKLGVFEKYSKNMENNYKALKPLKIQSSLNGVKIPKIQKFFEEGGDNNEVINEIDDNDLGDEGSDIEDEDVIYETNVTEVSDKNNIQIKKTFFGNLDNKKINLKHRESIKKKTNKIYNRANSK